MNKPLRTSIFVALLVSISVVLRIMISFIPNFQPVTAMVILVTLFIGTKYGLIFSYLSIIASNVYLGMGPWTLSQIASYSVVVLFVSMFMKMDASPFKLSVLAFTSSILYGISISVITVYIFNISNFWVYYGQGIWFDISHGVSSMVFIVVLLPVFKLTLEKVIEKS